MIDEDLRNAFGRHDVALADFAAGSNSSSVVPSGHLGTLSTGNPDTRRAPGGS